MENSIGLKRVMVKSWGHFCTEMYGSVETLKKVEPSDKCPALIFRVRKPYKLTQVSSGAVLLVTSNN